MLVQASNPSQLNPPASVGAKELTSSALAGEGDNAEVKKNMSILLVVKTTRTCVVKKAVKNLPYLSPVDWR